MSPSIDFGMREMLYHSQRRISNKTLKCERMRESFEKIKEKYLNEFKVLLPLP